MLPFEGLPAQDAAALRAMGPVWAEDINRHREQVVAAYTPLLAAADRRGISVHAGLAYGAHPRQRLDIYRSAATPARGAPVAVFVHGGAFMRGNMNSNAEIYGNVTRYISRHGYLAVNLEYRLAPEAPFPGGADDVAHALDWLRAHAGAHGGNPEHIVLIGHSAGGAHAASYALDIGGAGAGKHAGHGLSGLVLVSARLRADARADNPNAAGVRAYWGGDESLYEQRSPVTHAARLDLPTLVAVAEYENPHLDAYGAEFFQSALQAGAKGLRFLQVPGHNHTSIVAHLDTADLSFGPALIDFLDSTRPLSNQET